MTTELLPCRRCSAAPKVKWRMVYCSNAACENSEVGIAPLIWNDGEPGDVVATMMRVIDEGGGAPSRANIEAGLASAKHMHGYEFTRARPAPSADAVALAKSLAEKADICCERGAPFTTRLANDMLPLLTEALRAAHDAGVKEGRIAALKEAREACVCSACDTAIMLLEPLAK